MSKSSEKSETSTTSLSASSATEPDIKAESEEPKRIRDDHENWFKIDIWEKAQDAKVIPVNMRTSTRFCLSVGFILIMTILVMLGCSNLIRLYSEPPQRGLGFTTKSPDNSDIANCLTENIRNVYKNEPFQFQVNIFDIANLTDSRSVLMKFKIKPEQNRDMAFASQIDPFVQIDWNNFDNCYSLDTYSASSKLIRYYHGYIDELKMVYRPDHIRTSLAYFRLLLAQDISKQFKLCKSSGLPFCYHIRPDWSQGLGNQCNGPISGSVPCSCYQQRYRQVFQEKAFYDLVIDTTCSFSWCDQIINVALNIKDSRVVAKKQTIHFNLDQENPGECFKSVYFMSVSGNVLSKMLEESTAVSNFPSKDFNSWILADFIRSEIITKANKTFCPNVYDLFCQH